MTRFLSRSLIIVLVLALGLAAPVSAEEAPKPVEPPAGMKMFGEKEQKAQDQQTLIVAREMIRSRNYFGAAGLLEAILQHDENNVMVMNLLRTCYDQLGQPGRSEVMIRRMLENQPNSHVLHVYLAESLVKQGDTAAGLQEYETALGLVSNLQNNLVPLYTQVVQSMQSVGLTEQVLALIERLRTDLASPTLFAKQAGEIFESREEYRKAAEEFYAATADTSRVGVEAENKLMMMLQFPTAAPVVIEVLRERTVDTSATARAAQILANHYLQAGDMEQAMHYTLLRDSLGETNGAALLTFMNTCSDRGMYPQATIVGREIVKRYGDSPLLSQARYLYADALVNMGRYEEAIGVYDTIVATYPRVQDKAEAAYRTGQIYLDYLNEPKMALRMFDSVETTYPGGLGLLRALLATPDAYLRMGELDSARISLAMLGKRPLNEEAAEEAAFKLAKIDFYEKQFDSARAAFNKLLVSYPRGFYVNDALQLMLLIDEAGDEPLLYEFSNALLFEERRMDDSCTQRLELIAEAGHPALSDDALYRLAGMSIHRFDSTAALGYIDRLAETFPESYFTPWGLKLKGDMLVADPQRRGDGKAIYRQLLEEHANYPFASEVRKRLREMEEDPRTG